MKRPEDNLRGLGIAQGSAQGALLGAQEFRRKPPGGPQLPPGGPQDVPRPPREVPSGHPGPIRTPTGGPQIRPGGPRKPRRSTRATARPPRWPPGRFQNPPRGPRNPPKRPPGRPDEPPRRPPEPAGRPTSQLASRFAIPVRPLASESLIGPAECAERLNNFSSLGTPRDMRFKILGSS